VTTLGVLASILDKSPNSRCWKVVVIMIAGQVWKEMRHSLPLLPARGSNAEGTPVLREKSLMPSQVRLDCTAFSEKSRHQILNGLIFSI